jgi:hypothetical protein
MSGSGPGERKTDYFGTFLDVLSRGVTQVATALTNSGDLRDAALRALEAHGGRMSISDLLAPPFTSVGPLMSVVQDLQAFGLAEREGGFVQLTPDGEAVARKLADTSRRSTSAPS